MSGDASSVREDSHLPCWLPPLIFGVAVAVMTWPLGLAPWSRFIDGSFLWSQLWGSGLVAQALNSGSLGDLLYTDALNHPEGGGIILLGWTVHLAYWLFALALPPVFAFNLALLLHLWLGFQIAYLLVHRLTGDARGALLGGLVFGAAPCVLWGLRAGQIDQTSHALVPLLMLAVVAWMEHPRPWSARGAALLSGVGLSCLALLFSHPYGALFGAPLLVLWVVGRSLASGAWLRTTLRALAAAAACSPAALAAWLYLGRAEGSLLVPPMHHALGEPTEGITPALARLGELQLTLGWFPHEGEYHPYFLGLIPLVLAVLALGRRSRGQALGWLGLWAAFMALSLGNHGELFGARVPLPLLWLATLVPVFSVQFAYRIAIIARLALAVLVALGLASALARVPARWRLPSTLVLALLLGAEALQPGREGPLPVVEVRIPAVYGFLAEDAQAGALLEFPCQLGMNGDQHGAITQRLMAYQVFHGRPLGLKDKNNLLSTWVFREPALRTLATQCLDRDCGAGEAERQSVQRLRELGFTHLVLHQEEIDPAQRHIVERYLEQIAQPVRRYPDEGILLYELGGS
jgi:hypothetical protein